MTTTKVEMRLSILIFSLLITTGSAILQNNETETGREARLAEKTEEEPEIKLTPYQDAVAKYFIIRFNLTFPNRPSLLRAKVNIIRKIIEVQNHNAKYQKGEVDFQMAVYSFAWMTKEQLAATKMGLVATESELLPDPGDSPDQETENQRRKRAAPQFMANPSRCTVNKPTGSFSWLASGNVAPVQNQGRCGSCYIFATIAALESAVSIRYMKPPVKLSEQQMLECLNKGCKGGPFSSVWKQTKPDGVAASSSYKKYNAIATGTCSNSVPKEANSVVEKYLQIPVGDEDALKCHLVKYGPIAIGLDFSGKLMYYKSGIVTSAGIDCSLTSRINHASLLVGYGTENNKAGQPIDYWLIKNSYGSSWGEKGYLRLAMNQGNLCKVASYAQFPILKNIGSLPTAGPVTPGPDKTICANIIHFLLQNSTSIVNSACIVQQTRNYADSAAFCKSHGMSLFINDPATPQKTFLDAVGGFMGTATKQTVSLFIGGKISTLNCPGINNARKSFQYINLPCLQKTYSICQF